MLRSYHSSRQGTKAHGLWGHLSSVAVPLTKAGLPSSAGCSPVPDIHIPGYRKCQYVKNHINHMHQWAFDVFSNVCPQLPSYGCMGHIIFPPANLLKSTNAEINIFYILYNVQLANLMQLISSLSLSFAAPLCSNSVLLSSFQPFLFIIRALRSQSHDMVVMMLFPEH